MADEVFVTVSQCQYTLFCCAVSVVFQQLIENCFKIQPQPSQKVMSVPECPWKNHNTFVGTDNKEEDSSDYALCSFFFIQGTLCTPTVHPLLVNKFKMLRSRLGVSTLFYIPFYVFIYFCFSTKRFTYLCKLNRCHFVSVANFTSQSHCNGKEISFLLILYFLLYFYICVADKQQQKVAAHAELLFSLLSCFFLTFSFSSSSCLLNLRRVKQAPLVGLFNLY